MEGSNAEIVNESVVICYKFASIEINQVQKYLAMLFLFFLYFDQFNFLLVCSSGSFFLTF